MKSMTISVSNQLLGLNDDEKQLQNMNCINVSALDYKNLHIRCPKFEVKCLDSTIIESCNNSTIDDNIKKSSDSNDVEASDPNDVGSRLTTSGFLNSNCLSKFELDAREFPHKGIHTIIDGKIMERWMYMDIQSQVNTLLRFDRNHDISNTR